MVAPNCEFLYVCDLRVSLKCKLGQGAVVIKTSHCCEVFSRDAWGVVLANHSVSVGWISDNDGLSSTLSVVIDSFTSVDEDLTVIFEEVSTLHAWATGLCTNQEVEINILEGNLEITSDDDVVEEREGTVVKFCLNTLESVFSVG